MSKSLKMLMSSAAVPSGCEDISGLWFYCFVLFRFYLYSVPEHVAMFRAAVSSLFLCSRVPVSSRTRSKHRIGIYFSRQPNVVSKCNFRTCLGWLSQHDTDRHTKQLGYIVIVYQMLSAPEEELLHFFFFFSGICIVLDGTVSSSVYVSHQIVFEAEIQFYQKLHQSKHIQASEILLPRPISGR